jgi:hypothetical protein
MPPKFIPIGFVLIVFLYVIALTLDSISNAEHNTYQKTSQEVLDEMRARQYIKKLLQD